MRLWLKLLVAVLLALVICAGLYGISCLIVNHRSHIKIMPKPQPANRNGCLIQAARPGPPI